MSLIIGDAVDIQTLLRPALLPGDIHHAKISKQPFRAKELNSTSSIDELYRSKQGLKCCEWLSHNWSSCDHCSHLWVGLSHLYSAQLCSFLLRSHVKKWPNCRKFGTGAECHMTLQHQFQTVAWTLRNQCRTVRTFRKRLDGAKVSWVRSVSGPKCLYTLNTAT